MPVLDALALAADRLEGRSAAADRYPTPHDLAVDLDPRIVATPALQLLDAQLMDVAAGRCRRLVFTMPPQEGKAKGSAGRSSRGCWPEIRIFGSLSPPIRWASPADGAAPSETTS